MLQMCVCMQVCVDDDLTHIFDTCFIYIQKLESVFGRHLLSISLQQMHLRPVAVMTQKAKRGKEKELLHERE